MRNILWLILGFALASSAVSCIYRLGYIRGEIAAMVHADTAGKVGRRVPSAHHSSDRFAAASPVDMQSLHNEIALSGDCGGQGTARPTGASTDCNGEETAR